MVERNKVKTKNKTNLIDATAPGDIADVGGVLAKLVEAAEVTSTPIVTPAADVTTEADVTAEASAASAASAAASAVAADITTTASVAASAQDDIPDCIDDRFDVLEVLGKGGMGTVYKVRDRQVGTVFALKLLHQNLQSDPAVLKRFEQEAKAAERLDHPNLVPTYAHGVTQKGEPYLLIEYVQGETLAQIIEREGALDEDRAINLFRQICNALTYAHENQIVHRDIKPANLIVSRSLNGEETVRIVDFGIAKTLTEVDRSTRNLTQTGEVFGSPHYMSPEQCLGLMLDEKSDIYSLGCVIFEALSGKPPFAGSNPIQLVVKHINDKPKPYLPKFSASKKQQGLQSIALKCIEKETEDRFHDVAEIEHALERLKTGKSVGFDQNSKFRTSFFQKQLHITAFILPLFLIGFYAFMFVMSSLPSSSPRTDTPDDLLVSLVTLVLGFSILPTLLAAVFLSFARSCFKVAREKLATKRHWWTTFSLTLSSVMCIGSIPTFFYLGYAAYWGLHGRTWSPLSSLDLFLFPGFLLSVVCAIGVVICSIGFAVDAGPKKVALRSMLKRFGKPMAIALALFGILAGTHFADIVRKMSDIYAWMPPAIGSDMRTKTVALARQLSPGNKAMLTNSARVAAQTRNYPQAVIDNTELMALEPDKTSVDFQSSLRERAKLYTIGMQWEKAITDWTHLIELDPTSGYNFRMRGNCYFAQGNFARALRDYDESLLRNFTEPMSYYKKANAQIELDDLSGALRTLDQRARLYNGHRPALYLFRGYVLGLQGSKSGQLDNYRAAVDASREESSEWDEVARATAYLELGDEPNALRSLESAKKRGLTMYTFMGEETNMTNELRKKIVQFALQHNVFPSERWQDVRFPQSKP